jgi:hypothetical protein
MYGFLLGSLQEFLDNLLIINQKVWCREEAGFCRILKENTVRSRKMSKYSKKGVVKKLWRN